MKRKTILLLLAVVTSFVTAFGLIGCAHQHSFGTELQTSETHHYYVCECGEKKDYTEHDFGVEFQKNATHHWLECSCGAKSGYSEHAYTITEANSETLKAEATASTKAQYYKTCACGQISTTEYFETDKNATTLTVTMSGKTYDGTAVADPTYDKGTADGVVTIEWYQGENKLDTAPVNAGDYKVKVIVAETANYVGTSKTESFTIGKASPNLTGVTMSSVDIQYGNDYDVNYTRTGDGAVTKEYKVRGEDDNTYTTTAPINVGSYTARVTVAEASNYSSASSTVDFVISPITITGLVENFEYNGNSVHVKDISSEYSGVKVKIIFDDKKVGSEFLRTEVLENDVPTGNYIVDTNTCSVSIVKKELGVQWTAPTNLRFDETEKVATATLTGVVQGDDCVPETEKNGDNVWFDETFTYRVINLVGDDATNYKLPDNVDSAPYTITIDESVAVDEEMAVGSASWYDDTAPYVMYCSITLDAGYYYFHYTPVDQGVEFTFELYEKGNTTNVIATYEVDEYSDTSVAFEIEIDGTYYLKATTSDQTQYECVKIKEDVHDKVDAYGFCNKDCGLYQGDTIETGEEITLSLNKDEKAYYRLPCTRADHLYSRKFVSPLQSSDLAFYYNDGSEWQEIDWLTANPTNDFGSSNPDYIYVVITAGGAFEDGKFTMFEDHKIDSCGYYACGDKNGEYIGEDFETNMYDSITIARGEKKYYRFEADEGKLFAILCVEKPTSVSVVCYRIENGITVVQQLTKDAAELGDTDDGYYYIVFENEGMVEQEFVFQISKTNF